MRVTHNGSTARSVFYHLSSNLFVFASTARAVAAHESVDTALDKGRVADFKNTIIIMTSNLGSHLIQARFESAKDIDSAIEAAKIDVLGLLKQTIRPEFLNRIDDTIMFTPLTKENIVEIVGLQIKGITKMIAKQGITFDATPEAIKYLAKKGYNTVAEPW